MATALRACSIALLAVTACFVTGCAGQELEDTDGSNSAISGDVSVGTIVETTTSLRIRRTPSQDSSSNILGILPPGTKVMVLQSSAENGFYNIRVIEDDALVRALKTDTGWAYGEYLRGDEVEPGVEEEAEGETDDGGDQSPGELTVGSSFQADFEAKHCNSIRDDMGEFMTQTVNQFVINPGGNVPFAAMGIDSKALPYGTLIRIPEIDAKPAVARAGRSVVFKVTKTGDAPASAGVSTVTICTRASGFLPPANTKVTIEILELPSSSESK